MASTNYGIPNASVPCVSTNGTFNTSWYMFFLSLFNSVGGNSAVSIGSTSLANSIENLDISAGAAYIAPADPMIVAENITYRFILGKGWIPA